MFLTHTWCVCNSNRFTFVLSVNQCTNIKLNSSGGGPHRPWRNVDSERTSTPRLRLGVLASLLVYIALELHLVVHRRLCNMVDSVGGQVQLGCASYLPPHQQCSEVVLSVHQTPMQCWFWGRTSTSILESFEMAVPSDPKVFRIFFIISNAKVVSWLPL